MQIGKSIKRLDKLFERAINGVLARHGLTVAQLELLRYVKQKSEAGETVNQKQIEEALGITNPTVTGLLKRLEAKGLVERTPDPLDKRAKRIRLTARESAFRDEVTASAQDAQKQLTKGFTPAEMDALEDLLTRMIDNLERENL